MQINIQPLLTQYVSDIVKIYGSHLKKVILYGSYARGDYHEFSDIDIMILVDLDNSTIEANDEALFDATFERGFDNKVIISPMVENIDHFNKWLGAYPFYSNVQKEGVEVYAAA